MVLAADLDIPQQIGFWALALAMSVSAIRVVTVTNVVRAALHLVIVLAGAAGLFILLAAEFVAVVQVLVYIGAIVVLFLFGIMLTRAPIGRTADLDNDQRWLGALVSVFLLAVLVAVLQDAYGDTQLEDVAIERTGDVGLALFQTYVVPFEVVSVLLLAALVGAVVIARRD